MTEEQFPQTPVNAPRPVRLIGNTDSSPVPETPPLLPSIDGLLPGIDDFEIEAYNTLKMYTVEPITNGRMRWIPQEDLQFADGVGMETEISAYPTAKMQVVKPAAAVSVSSEQANRPIYANTPYARRLERHQRAREKKLSWKDLRQFGQ
ncbi:MAG TPA: hypothetical protein VJ761_23440, partial [Ktedonobacteraceae bacterium]|nr:hypothetical protein [Ktedonobacteraceae bacterium]